jgi:hypothetical protein
MLFGRNGGEDMVIDQNPSVVGGSLVAGRDGRDEPGCDA